MEKAGSHIYEYGDQLIYLVGNYEWAIIGVIPDTYQQYPHSPNKYII